MEPYYKLVPYAIKESTRQKLLDLAGDKFKKKNEYFNN